MVTHVPCGGIKLAGVDFEATPAGRLQIVASQVFIDGAGETLGGASPTFVWSDCPGVSFIGRMAFDVDDLAQLSEPELELLYLHEMAHVIGFGSVPSKADVYQQTPTGFNNTFTFQYDQRGTDVIALCIALIKLHDASRFCSGCSICYASWMSLTLPPPRVFEGSVFFHCPVDLHYSRCRLQYVLFLLNLRRTCKHLSRHASRHGSAMTQ